MKLASRGYLLFALYLLLNVLLTITLMSLSYGYIVVAVFVVGGHARDLFSVFYQLLHMRKITARCSDTTPQEEGAAATAATTTICCLVPVYKEDAVMVKKNLDSLTTQQLSAGTTVVVVLLFDGLADHNRDLYNSVANLSKAQSQSQSQSQAQVQSQSHAKEEGRHLSQDWRSKKNVELAYSVGRYNGTAVVLSHKAERSGKKDSLIIGENFITSALPAIEAVGAGRADFIYHTDGDTVSDRNCLGEMLRSLEHDATLDGVSGLVRAYTRHDASCTERAFAVMQDFQYFFSLIVRRMTESLMSSTTCLPGCCNMVRVGARSNFAIAKYGNLPPDGNSLIQAATRLQGTDRRYTTLLLRQGSRLKMNWRAFVRTEPPVTVRSFINQRRRWSSNAFFNSVSLLYSSNIPLYIKVSAAVDIGRTSTAIFRLISYISFWMFIEKFSTPNLIFLSIAVVLPYVYAFAWIACIVPEWGQMTAGFLLNKIFMPVLSAVAVTKMFMISTNFAWSGAGEAKDKGAASRRPPEPHCSSPTRTPSYCSPAAAPARAFFP